MCDRPRLHRVADRFNLCDEGQERPRRRCRPICGRHDQSRQDPYSGARPGHPRTGGGAKRQPQGRYETGTCRHVHHRRADSIQARLETTSTRHVLCRSGNAITGSGRSAWELDSAGVDQPGGYDRTDSRLAPR